MAGFNREESSTDVVNVDDAGGSSVDVLDQLRSFPESRPRPSVERVSRELQDRSDPDRVAGPTGLELPWSERARVRAKARQSAFEARLEIFKDDLRAIRIANEVLNRAATMRAVEASEIAIFEIRCLGETTRLAILNRAQLDMTRQFVVQLESIETFRGRLTDEVLDALKERALTEFTERMNRASKADLEFCKADILRLKP
jgi:hypothetical protein